jgi:peroxiredoxin
MRYFSIFCFLLLISCQDKNKTILTGTIQNPRSEYVHLTVGDSIYTQKLKEDNSFNFEVNLSEPGYFRFDHEEHTFLFLSPGEKIHFDLNAKEFDESLKFSGDLADNNNYLAWQTLEFEKIKNQRNTIYSLQKDRFTTFIDSVTNNALIKLNSIHNPDSIFFSTEKGKIQDFKQSFLDSYSKMFLLQKGNPAPDFTCIDKTGKAFSLSNFKGKTLCIDVWASWCSGCFNEFPYYEKLKQNFLANINFISISVDDKKDTWLNTLQKKNLEGIQLWAPDGKDSEFTLDYFLLECGLPCFIIIDNEGKIIDSRAPRPSENLEEVLKTIEAKK